MKSYSSIRSLPFRRRKARATIDRVKHDTHAWSLVLAAGEGSRLQGLTRNVHGVPVPKQFCSLQGGPSLLQEALQRAATVAPMQRVCTVVAAQHRQWWTSMLGGFPRQNVIVQPHNRGTAHGILLPLLRVAEVDPDAVIVILPADHYLRDEDTMIASLREASKLARSNLDWIYLLGLEPTEPDCELGYILPAAPCRPAASGVMRFVEKPESHAARALMDEGALWNSFIMAGSVRALLGLYDASFTPAVEAMQGFDSRAFDQTYGLLRTSDFSRDVLTGNEHALRVLPVPQCGWTDLGTPARVEQTLQRLLEAASRPAMRPYFPTHLNLADQCSRLGLGAQANGRWAGSAELHV